jgi:hypothetical protein
MPIFNNACAQDPIAFDATILPSSIRSEATGEILLLPQSMSTSCYVPPTIRFGSLVFEHQENIDPLLDKAQGSNSIYVGNIPIDLSSGQNSIEQDSGNSPNFDSLKDKVHLVQNCHICSTSQHRKVIHTKRSETRTSQCTDERLEILHFVEIAQLGFYMKLCPGGWIDDTMPIKKGDPGRRVISIAIGQQQFDEVICNIGSGVNIIPKVIYDNVL